MKKAIIKSIAAISSIMVMALAVIPSAPAQAATMYIGEVSPQKACVTDLGISEFMLTEPNADGWRCVAKSGSTRIYLPVNFNKECVRLTKNPAAYAEYLNFRDPYSWRCYY